jgi:hypothetical protein
MRKILRRNGGLQDSDCWTFLSQKKIVNFADYVQLIYKEKEARYKEEYA